MKSFHESNKLFLPSQSEPNFVRAFPTSPTPFSPKSAFPNFKAPQPRHLHSEY
jgi:hypothetical protein